VELLRKYPDLTVEMLEIYHNTTNLERFTTMSHEYGQEDAGIPAIFIGNRSLIWDQEIHDHLEESVLAEEQRIASCTPATPAENVSAVPGSGCVQGSVPLSPQLVVVSAFFDSLNPCALAVLIFLLLSLSAAENQRRILLVGATYVVALFLFHLLAGVGIFSVVTVSGVSRIFSLLGGAMALLFGLMTLVDVLKNKEKYLLAIPESKKKMLEHYIRNATLPAAFILGILAGLFGFSCTGGIYISILALMSRDFTLLSGLPYLLLYNVVFILPLALLVLFVAYGVSPERANTWRVENRRVLRLVVGLAMVALGIVIVSGWL
jgi:cytochrome c biogenesis protein CcdA